LHGAPELPITRTNLKSGSVMPHPGNSRPEERTVDNIGRWVTSGVIGLIGILGLFVASRATDDTFYSLGLIVFVIAVAVIFYMIRRAFDEAGARPRGPGDTAAHNN
jgi:hypothetical protein